MADTLATAIEESTKVTEPVADPATDTTPVKAENTPAESTQPSPEPEAVETPKKKEPWYQERFNKLSQQKNEWKAKAEVLEKMLLQGGGGTPTQQQQAAPEVAPPQRNQFQDPEAFSQAMIDYKVALAVPAAVQRHLAVQQQQSVQTEFQTKEKAFKEVAPDYDEVIEQANSIALTPASSAAIQTALGASDNGPALKYYLATHPEEVDGLNRMSTEQALYKIGKIEAKMAVPEKKAAPAVTKAPAPIKPVGGGTENKIDPNKLTDEDWFRQRQKQAMARSGGGRM